MNPYQQLVEASADWLRRGKEFPLGGWDPCPTKAANPGAGKVLLFSPHPDDEVIVGGLALRLKRQSGLEVINVAVTQGSNKARQAGRWEELVACCRHIGFGLIQTQPGGLEGVHLKTRTGQPQLWEPGVRRVAEILATEKPHIIFFPHADDWNATHIGTHHLVVDALTRLGPGFQCFTVETEFWGAMDDPNLMVESSAQDLADMMTALSFHVGEVRRNPYHLRTPAWMIDNVRRGGELVGGQGGAAPDFAYGTLYRLRRWSNGFHGVLPSGRFLPATVDPLTLFPPPATAG